MAIFNGKNLTVEILGESHSDSVSVAVKGFPEFSFNKEELNVFMSRRRASIDVFSTSRIEPDIPEFFGVSDGKITGEFKAVIKNTNVKSKDYDYLYGIPRPSHADYAWYKKDGTLDFSGGGRFSARLTAPLCVLGGIAKQYLESRGIMIAAYIQSVGSVQGRSYRQGELPYGEVMSLSNGFPSLDKKQEMLKEISVARGRGDSVGGVIECIVYGMPAGVGDNLFEGLEGKIASLIYAVPAVKGVEFGWGFDMASSYGSVMNDELCYDGCDVKLKSNHGGGINGGISNGSNLTMRVALKPTPSISSKQNTVDLVSKENVQIEIKGRHDACLAVRAVPCIESAVCIAILDEIL